MFSSLASSRPWGLMANPLATMVRVATSEDRPIFPSPVACDAMTELQGGLEDFFICLVYLSENGRIFIHYGSAFHRFTHSEDV